MSTQPNPHLVKAAVMNAVQMAAWHLNNQRFHTTVADIQLYETIWDLIQAQYSGEADNTKNSYIPQLHDPFPASDLVETIHELLAKRPEEEAA